MVVDSFRQVIDQFLNKNPEVDQGVFIDGINRITSEISDMIMHGAVIDKKGNTYQVPALIEETIKTYGYETFSSFYIDKKTHRNVIGVGPGILSRLGYQVDSDGNFLLFRPKILFIQEDKICYSLEDLVSGFTQYSIKRMANIEIPAKLHPRPTTFIKYFFKELADQHGYGQVEVFHPVHQFDRVTQTRLNDK